MKLTDLEPRWALDADIMVDGTVVHNEHRQGMGLTFLCPHCKAVRLGVFIQNPVDGLPPSDDAKMLWARVSGSTFEDLTLSPSIDASKSGHWHGFIQRGETL